MRIERSALLAALRAFALSGHGLVIGVPGVGKSYTLASLAASFDGTEVRYLFIPVEELGGASEEELRLVLGYPTTFAAALTELYASAPVGVLIFDGFDAARSDDTRARVLQLILAAIRSAPAGWTVLASARTYDASKSLTLHRAFSNRAAPAPPEYVDARFSSRHFQIPELSPDEVTDALSALPALAAIHDATSAGFRRLLRIPFHLWLVERILRANPSAELSALSSEVQLLARYWERYVTGTPDSLARLSLLRALAAGMVRERRLTVAPPDDSSPGQPQSLAALLSDEVLAHSGSGEGRIRFSHNILFDYAVSVLTLDEDVERLISFLTDDLSRPLFLRPSITYYFARLWHAERDRFWSCFLRLLSCEDVGIRLVARIIPPTVIARDCRGAVELAPLLQGLQRTPEVASQAVLRTLQALRFAPPQSAAVWAEISAELALAPAPTFGWELGALLTQLLRDLERHPQPDALASCGVAARRLLDWAWTARSENPRWMDAFGAVHGVPLVIRSFSTDRTASASLLRRLLTLLTHPSFPLEYFRSLCHDVGALSRFDIALVVDVYRAVFGHRELSNEKTDFGGIVLALTSTRRQDFEMLHYSLRSAFPDVLLAHPLEAVRLSFALLSRYAIKEQLLPYLREGATLGEMEESFIFLGKQRRYLPDLSVSWFQGVHRDDVLAICADAASYLSGDDCTLDPTDAIAAIADECLAASTWSSLLDIGAKAPYRYARPLHELALAAPVQVGVDTIYALGSFIESAADYWEPAQRAALENSLFTLPQRWEADSRPSSAEAESADSDVDRSRTVSERARDRLLARIPSRLLATPWARERAMVLAAKGEYSANEPLVRFTSSSREYTTDDWLIESGVQLADPVNRDLRDLAARASAFAERWRNSVPDSAAVDAFVGTFREDVEAATMSPPVETLLHEFVWTKLAEAASTLAKTRPTSARPLRVLCAKVLLLGAGFPASEEASSRSFETPAWSPTPRTEAVSGLAYLLSTSFDPAASDALVRLSKSPVPSDRFIVIQWARLLISPAPETFWEIVEDRTVNEATESIVSQLLVTLSHVDYRDARRDDTVRRLLPRALRSESATLLRESANWLAYFSCRLDEKWAWEEVASAVDHFSTRGDLVSEFAFRAINEVRPERPPTPDQRLAEERAVEWIQVLLSKLREVVTRPTNSEADADASVRPAYALVELLVNRVYFNATPRGASYDSEGDEAASPRVSLGDYYRKTRPILDAIVAFGRPSDGGGLLPSTAHRFMGFLNLVLPYDPVGVLGLAAAVTVAAVPGRYHLDALAVEDVVRLVDTVLADFRGDVASGAGLEHLLTLLDVFADAGWTEALQLVWRLDEVYR